MLDMRGFQISDSALRNAIDQSQSWDETFVRLGYTGRAGGSTRQRLRGQARLCGAATDHFVKPRPGPRRQWTDDDLTRAVAEEPSWTAVVQRLHSSYSLARRYALDLGLDTARLDSLNHLTPSTVKPLSAARQMGGLRRAAEPVAMAWYALHGFDVFAPTFGEGRVDFLAVLDERTTRVQAKSATRRDPRSGVWSVRVQCRDAGVNKWRPYRVGEVDELFVVCLDGQMFRLPSGTFEQGRCLNLGLKYAQYSVSLFQQDVAQRG